MSEMIPDAAVEAAARQMAGGGGGQFDWTIFRHRARAALEAAAPHMLADAKAEALREAAELIEPFSGIGMANGATRADISQWLRARADMFRPTP